MSERIPSIKDVARHSGTSISTVSNVINNRRAVSDELRERVQNSVRELGYTANPIARSLKSRKSNTIGVVVLDINCIFFAPLLKGIQKVLSGAGYNMSIYDCNYSPERELEYIRTMQSSWVDGLIIAGISAQVYPEHYKGMMEDEVGRRMPIVSIETNMNRYGIDSVFIDNQTSACTATSHLLELDCKRIAHIQGPSPTSNSTTRLLGYKDALAHAGIPYDARLICQGDFSPISGYNAIHTLIQAGTSFDGVFAANDQMAVGALRALGNAGIRVPEQVKVVGFDNTFIASIVNPGLTTINVPNYTMGVSAARLLLDRIAHPEKKPVAVMMEYELIIRRSTMASARTNWDMAYW